MKRIKKRFVMSRAAITILLLASQFSATEQSVKLNSGTRIKITSLETRSHCIDYDNFVYSTPAQAISYYDSSRRYGAVDCLQGDVVLAGTYINLGNTVEFYTSQCLQIRVYELCMMD